MRPPDSCHSLPWMDAVMLPEFPASLLIQAKVIGWTCPIASVNWPPPGPVVVHAPRPSASSGDQAFRGEVHFFPDSDSQAQGGPSLHHAKRLTSRWS